MLTLPARWNNRLLLQRSHRDSGFRISADLRNLPVKQSAHEDAQPAQAVSHWELSTGGRRNFVTGKLG